jgi:acetyl/propionyl-CoA carboxylase alpha subunit/acetyl-CoA carboxylase carboxyltransferase component
MTQDFTRIAIVNRGEPAMRFICAAREFNNERGTALRTVALFTRPDHQAMFVREADEACDLGEPFFADPRDGRRKFRYLDYGLLERALTDAGIDAVWSGWGPAAEDPRFVELLERLRIVFIGPSSAAMRRVGNRAAKQLAQSLGIGVVPWSGGPVREDGDAMAAATLLGYPLLVKASAGGRGIRRAASPEALPDAIARARKEAASAFGDPEVFLEKCLEGVRHLEVPVVGDRQGALWTCGVRDCTIRRDERRVLVECPPPRLDPEVERAATGAAARIAGAARYESAGSAEFLFHPGTAALYFVQFRAHLQAEHTVTEVATGLDLVKLQIHVARGGCLEGAPTPPRGHAIAVRVSAEEPDGGFEPAPGRLVLFRLPTGPGLRIDRGVTEGDTVPPGCDATLAKIVACGRDRTEALARLRRALVESAIVLAGGTTDRAFLLELLSHPEVREADVDSGWLARTMARPLLPRPHADAAFVEAAIEEHEAMSARERSRFFETAARLRPDAAPDSVRTVELCEGGRSYRARVWRLGPEEYRVDVDGHRLQARVEPLGRFARWLVLGEVRHRIVSVPQDSVHLVEVDGFPHRFCRNDARIVRAPAPAVVVSLAVKAGDEVRKGDPLAVLEAMKMETTVAAPCAGHVREVLVAANTQVAPGTPLVRLRPGREERTFPGERIAFTSTASAAPRTPRDRALAHLETLKRLVLGFDSDPAEASALVPDYARLALEWPGDGERHRLEDEILAVFADLASVCRRKAPDEDEELGSPSAGEHFLTYLRSVESRGGSLPQGFLERLERVLAHYGVSGLEPTPALLDALVWVFKAQRRLGVSAEAVTAILERRLESPSEVQAGLAGLLDRLIDAGEGRRPALCDMAREVRYRLFDQPLYEARRRRVYDEAQAHLETLRTGSDAALREAAVSALVACPQPLQRLVSARLEGETPAMRGALLEVLVRRYYRTRELAQVRVSSDAKRALVRAEYPLDGRRVRLLATHARAGELADALRFLLPLVSDPPDGEDVVLDLCLWHDGALAPAEQNAQSVREVLDAVLGDRRLRRVGITFGVPGNGQWESSLQYFTFRSGRGGFREDQLYRGFHTMIGKRLRLWRMSEFELERLPSVEDVYVFRGVARNNPRDERLFGLAEVRDVTPVRDDGGRLVAVPHLERMFMEVLAAIRCCQGRRKPEERLHWNRVLLDVWPPLLFSRDEILAIARKLLPATEGLGIETVMLRAEVPDVATGKLRTSLFSVSSPGRRGLSLTEVAPATGPIRPLSEYGQKVTRLRQRGLAYPYEIVRLMTPAAAAASDFPPGVFEELDLDAQGRLHTVDRPFGRNTANVVAGLISNATPRYPEGMRRVVLLGDPSREMGSLAEPECRRILAALDLAETLKVPLEWFTLSAGAKISMESGTENMDWIARVLRRLVQFTQAGGEVNLIVCGINVGAQPYWNAEATMLMHTRGILVMVPDAAMVLTGKTALDYSGSVSAEDNLGIGGYDRIMGPNGQAQYWAADLPDACSILFRHYEYAYVAPGERFPRRAPTRDPRDRDVCLFPHGEGADGFALTGDVFSDVTNPGRKKPFEIRRVMAACADQDHQAMERWAGWREAEMAVVWDARLGGIPVCMIGFESRPLPRLDFAPTDGPDHWTSGTLFPKASKKVARAINAASGNRPVVILANLAGFDGSPESMRRLQLEYGAEIGRAVVNFRGPLVFVVVSRYHGGAFVVFSKALNERLEVAALRGTFASVIGGAPAAAVVFARDVDARSKKDPRVEAAQADLGAAPEAEKRRLRGRLAALAQEVRAEKLGEVAEEFDRVHSVERALRVGSLDRIVPPAQLRPYLIDALERGLARENVDELEAAGVVS